MKTRLNLWRLLYTFSTLFLYCFILSRLFWIYWTWTMSTLCYYSIYLSLIPLRLFSSWWIELIYFGIWYIFYFNFGSSFYFFYISYIIMVSVFTEVAASFNIFTWVGQSGWELTDSSTHILSGFKAFYSIFLSVSQPLCFSAKFIKSYSFGYCKFVLRNYCWAALW